ncbi:Aminoacyl carrier protein 2 [compost metagenome]
MEYEIGLSDPLVDLGLSSMAMVVLVVRFEEHFDITYEDDELLFENFATVQKIAECIMAKLSSHQV